MKNTVFRFVKIALVILLVLAIAFIEVSVRISPDEFIFCIAPVGTCPPVHWSPRP